MHRPDAENNERGAPQSTEDLTLPHALPQQAAVEAVGRYLSAYGESGAGADWVDVFPLSGARVALVVNHCLHSSMTVGRLRAVVQALCSFEMPPDELLAHLDSVIARKFSGCTDLAARATCLCAVYDPVTRWCSLASAGHPPPGLLLPDGTVEMVDIPLGPALGLGGVPFEETDVRLPEGGVLAFYTESLVSHCAEGDGQGVSGLRRRLAVPARSLEDVCDSLLNGLDRDMTGDDVVLLLARVRAIDTDHTAAWEFPADLAAVATARSRAARTLVRWGLDTAVFPTEIIVSELVTNSIRYASGPIELRLTFHDDSLSCEVADGSGTFPRLQRARLDDEGGRGLLMVAQLCRRWGTRATGSGKVVWTDQAVEPATSGT